MEDFTRFEFPYEAWPARPVYRTGEGRAVVLMHELPGMIPECVELARRLARAGLTVYLPLLFGEPNQPVGDVTTLKYAAQLCISREFQVFARHESSPITDWLRALCRRAHEECGGPGVGVIGMCLTGGFVLSLMADPSVLAPVLAQPSLPFAVTHAGKASLGLPPVELQVAQERAAKGASPLALRFTQDRTSPAARFDSLRAAFGGTPTIIEDSPELCWRRGRRLETIEINSRSGNPYGIDEASHSTLTLGYRSDPEHPTHRAFLRVVSFLQERLTDTGPTIP